MEVPAMRPTLSGPPRLAPSMSSMRLFSWSAGLSQYTWLESALLSTIAKSHKEQHWIDKQLKLDYWHRCCR